MVKRLRRRRSTLAALVTVIAGTVAALAIAGAQAGTRTAQPKKTPPVVSRSALAFHDGMRKLWEDHITWTRNVIISFQVNEPDPNVALPDLNAADIEGAMKMIAGTARSMGLEVVD